jgi:amino acid transporter
MAAYLLLTFGAMVVVPQSQANGTYAILQAVQIALGTPIAWIVTLILIAFFMFNTTVYNYSFARLLFVSGIDRRLPAFMGRVNANKVPQNAVLVQAALTTVVTLITFFVFGFGSNVNLGTQIYLVLQAAVTVIWCVSMVMLFADVLIIRSKYPEEFRREQLAPVGVFFLASIVGAIASAVGIWVTLTGSWNSGLIGNTDWLLLVGGVAVISLAVAIVVYLLGIDQARRAVAEAKTT